MKIKKTVLQAIAVSAFVGIVATSCQKVNDELPIGTALEKMHLKKKSPPPPDNCLACGMG